MSQLDPIKRILNYVIIPVFALLIVSPGPKSWAAVEVADDGSTISTRNYSQSGESFRDQRKIGFSTSILGLQGLAGAGISVNLTPTHQFSTQFGIGTGYQTFTAKYRYFFGGEWFTPYLAAGLSRWYTVGQKSGRLNDSNPRFLKEKFLSESELASGEFSKTFIAPSMGLHYNQLRGDLAGIGIFAEVQLLVQFPEIISEPIGEIGVDFFF